MKNLLTVHNFFSLFLSSFKHTRKDKKPHASRKEKEKRIFHCQQPKHDKYATEENPLFQT